MRETRRYTLKRYIQVLNRKIVDTTLLLPHVETYYVKDSKLFVETVDGNEYYLGLIVRESDNLDDLCGDLEFADGPKVSK